MSVWVLGSLAPPQPNSKGVNQALAAERMGSRTHLIATREALDSAELTGGKVFLAQLETPADAIAQFFAIPAAQAGRKILNMSPATEAGHSLIGQADMLIFGQSDFAAFMQLDCEPWTVERLLPIQPLLTRHNQAAVVILDGIGTVAIWADRTMLVGSFTPDAISEGLPADCICGVIAAAVEQGIGPERAMTLACAAASEAATNAIPVRAQIERRIEAAGR
jgi:ribokinase